MTSPVFTLPARAAFDPVDGVSQTVESRRWVAPTLLLVVCAALAALAFWLRWNPAPTVLQELQMTGQMSGISEADLETKIVEAGRKALVGGLAAATFLSPLRVLALACVLWVVAWLFDRKADFRALLTVAAVALVPFALFNLVSAAILFGQHEVTLPRLARLVPSSLAALKQQGPPSKALGFLRGADFFNLWGAALLGLGFSSATGMRKGRGLLVAFVLYALYVGVFYVGMPAMMMRGGGR